jgi:ComF family protein
MAVDGYQRGGERHLHNFSLRWAPATVIARVAAAFQEMLFPAKCAMCGRFRGRCVQPRRAGPNAGPPAAADLLEAVLCAGCRADCRTLQSPICRVCGTEFKSREGDDRLCGDCIERPKPFTMARAALVYTPVVKTLVHHYKYRGKIQLAEPFGALLLDAFERHWQPDAVDLILPVPLHRRRLRLRGFNQAVLMLGHWPQTVVAGQLPPLKRNLLIRHRRTVPQTGLNRRARFDNVAQAFRLTDPEAIRDRRILLVDDVYTTGATVTACAGVLAKGGARRVDVLALARAVH